MTELEYETDIYCAGLPSAETLEYENTSSSIVFDNTMRHGVPIPSRLSKRDRKRLRRHQHDHYEDLNSTWVRVYNHRRRQYRCRLRLHHHIDFNETYIDNITIEFSVNETHDSNLTIDWGIGTIIFNSSDDSITTARTPSPTRDSHYFGDVDTAYHHHNLVADHQSSYDEYLYVIEIQYVVSDPPYNSLLKVSVTVGDDFDETSTNVVVLVADDEE